jgi:chemotaxis family two-component system response regulator Rcp1
LKESHAVRILMVEDNTGDVRLTQEAFADAGLDNELRVAHDGEDALVKLGFDLDDLDGERHSVDLPDLMIIDLNLPKIDGRELVEVMKRTVPLTHIPVIILTNSLDDRHLTISHLLPTRAYVEKPITVPSLINALQSYPAFGFQITRRTADKDA